MGIKRAPVCSWWLIIKLTSYSFYCMLQHLKCQCVCVCARLCVSTSWWFACLFALLETMFTNPIQMPMSDDLPKSLPLTCLNLNSMRKSCAFFLLLLAFCRCYFWGIGGRGSLQTSCLANRFCCVQNTYQKSAAQTVYNVWSIYKCKDRDAEY